MYGFFPFLYKGPALETLRRFSEAGKQFDMMFLDGDDKDNIEIVKVISYIEIIIVGSYREIIKVGPDIEIVKVGFYREII